MTASGILSLLMSLALLLSGGYMAEDPAAPAGRTTTIDEIVLTLDGTEYPLDVSAAFGTGTNAESGVFDFFLTAGGETLFPMQAKVSDDGLSLLLGDSETVYTLSAEYLDALVSSVPDAEEFLSLMTSEFESMAALQTVDEFVPDEEALAAFIEEFNAIIGDDYIAEDASIFSSSARLPATRTTFSLDPERLGAALDAYLAMIGEDFTAPFFDMYNAQLAASGMDVEFSSFSEMLAYLEELGAQMWLEDFEILATEEDPDLSEVSGELVAWWPDNYLYMRVPIHVRAEAADRTTTEMSLIVNDFGTLFDISTRVDGGYTSMSYEMNLLDTLTLDMDFEALESADGSIEESMEMTMRLMDYAGTLYLTDSLDSLPNPTTDFTMTLDGGTDASGDAVYDFGMRLTSEQLGDLGLSFRVSDIAGEVADRTAGLDEIVVTSDEDMATAGSALALSAMGLAADVDPLLSDPSVVAVIDAVNALVEEGYFDSWITVPYEDSTTTTVTSSDPDDLSFTVPAFTVLPEGYALGDAWVDFWTEEYDDGTVNTYGDLYMTFTNEDGYIISANFYRYPYSTSSAETAYFIDDGAVIRQDGMQVDLDFFEDGGGNVYFHADELTSVSLFWDDPALTEDDILDMLAGIVGPVDKPEEGAASVDSESDAEAVRPVQQMLISVGLLGEGEDDGIYGENTTAAVTRFQEWWNAQTGLTVLPETGIADPLTLAYLECASERGLDMNIAPAPTAVPTAAPTPAPTAEPTAEPTPVPTAEPTTEPTAEPTPAPTAEPTATPTAEPTATPTATPTAEPTDGPESTDDPDAGAAALSAFGHHRHSFGHC